jgi:hypothetical protein
MAAYQTFTTARATEPDPASLLAQLRAAVDATVGVQHLVGSGYVVKKATAWTAPQIAAAQSAIDTAPNATDQLTAQAFIDTLPLWAQGLALALVDELNRLRTQPTTVFATITNAQAIAAIRAKAGDIVMSTTTKKVSWSLVISVVGLLAGWSTGACRTYAAIDSRIKAVELRETQHSRRVQGAARRPPRDQPRREASAGAAMKRVKATREGLVGGKTASGYVIDTIVPFVALPSTKAIGRFVHVRNPRTGKSTLAVVLDVGPWNEHDTDYVFGDARPAAESGKDTRNRDTNHAGIDLSEKVWKALGMTGNEPVEWEFVA